MYEINFIKTLYTAKNEIYTHVIRHGASCKQAKRRRTGTGALPVTVSGILHPVSVLLNYSAQIRRGYLQHFTENRVLHFLPEIL